MSRLRRQDRWRVGYVALGICAASLLTAFGNPSTPNVGQWATYGGNEPTVTNGSFQFPDANGVAGYFYTHLASVPKLGQTLTLNYSVNGNNPVWQQHRQPPPAATDINPPTIHLFLWRFGDNMSCNGAYDFYRMFAARTPLILGDNQVISVVLNSPPWTSCLAHTDATAFAATLNNLLGAGFVFGGQHFAGHGIYVSNGTATFKINSFTIQ
jgi:hypothetical protein